MKKILMTSIAAVALSPAVIADDNWYPTTVYTFRQDTGLSWRTGLSMPIQEFNRGSLDAYALTNNRTFSDLFNDGPNGSNNLYLGAGLAMDLQRDDRWDLRLVLGWNGRMKKLDNWDQDGFNLGLRGTIRF